MYRSNPSTTRTLLRFRAKGRRLSGSNSRDPWAERSPKFESPSAPTLRSPRGASMMRRLTLTSRRKRGRISILRSTDSTVARFVASPVGSATVTSFSRIPRGRNPTSARPTSTSRFRASSILGSSQVARASGSRKRERAKAVPRYNTARTSTEIPPRRRSFRPAVDGDAFDMSFLGSTYGSHVAS